MSDIPEFIHIVKHAPWYDVFVLVITLLLTIFTDLVIAVTIGVIIAMFLFMVRTHQTVHVNPQKFTAVDQLESNFKHLFVLGGMVYTIEGPFFFGVTEKIEHALAVTHTDPKFVVLRFINVPFIDMTGLETLSKIIEQYRKRHVRVYICEANKGVSQKLSKIGILDKIENSIIFESINHIAQYSMEETKIISETPIIALSLHSSAV